MGRAQNSSRALTSARRADEVRDDGFADVFGVRRGADRGEPDADSPVLDAPLPDGMLRWEVTAEVADPERFIAGLAGLPTVHLAPGYERCEPLLPDPDSVFPFVLDRGGIGFAPGRAVKLYVVGSLADDALRQFNELCKVLGVNSQRTSCYPI